MWFRSLCVSAALMLSPTLVMAAPLFEQIGVRTHGFHFLEGARAELGTINPDHGSSSAIFGLNTSAGTIFSPNVDLTLGLRYWSTDLDPDENVSSDGSFSDFSLHGDLNYHLFKVFGFRPYGLAGIGAHFVSADVPGESQLEESIGGFKPGLDLGIGAATSKKGLGVRVEARREALSDAGNWNYTVGVGWWPGEKAVRVPTSGAAAAPAQAAAPAPTTAPVAPSTAPTTSGLSLAEAAALQSTIDRLTAENATLRAQSGGGAATVPAAPATASTPESRAAAQRAAFQRVARLCGDPDGYSDGSNGPSFVSEHLVTFEEGGARLDARDQEQVRRVAVLLLMFPGSTAAIEGHADSGGSVAANQKVTTARAESVRGELVRLGVPSGALTARGVGSSRPMVDNASTGRLANRRVSIRVNGAAIR